MAFARGSHAGSAAATSKLVDAMYRIRKISTQMLGEKMKESNLLNDSDAKRDIMSILVRARKAELNGGKGGYAMSDRAMMDQVVSILRSPLMISCLKSVTAYVPRCWS